MARKQNMKRCTKTGKMFPATPEFFYRDKTQKDGLSSWSKDAEKAYNKAYFSALGKVGVTRKSEIAKDAKKLGAFERVMKAERVQRKSQTPTTKATTKAATKRTTKAPVKRTTKRVAKSA